MSPLLEILVEANDRHWHTLHPRWAMVATWASQRLDAEAQRPTIGAGGKRADVAAWLDLEQLGDPLDVPRLFRAFVRNVTSGVAAERVLALSKRRDARIVSGLLALLEAPPYRAGTALPFFRTCVAALVTSKDPRAAAGLDDLSKRYKTIVETSIGERIAELCARGAKQLAGSSAGELTDDDVRRLAELEQLFETERRAHEGRRATNRAQAKSEHDLLEAVYASPDDDGPRLVLADALLERGEVRGEFISLQVRRAAGDGTFESLAREQELLADGKRASALGLPLSAAATCTFHRGFPLHVHLGRTGLKPVTGLSAWKTVNAVALPNGASGVALRALLDHPCMERVSHVVQLTHEHRKALGATPRQWTRVGIVVTEEAPLVPLRQTFPRLTALTLSSQPPLPAGVLEGLSNVETLSIAGWGGLPPGDWLAGFPKLRTFELRSNDAAWLTRAQLTALPLRELRLAFATTPEPFEGLTLERLTLRARDQQTVHAIVRAATAIGELAVAFDLRTDLSSLLTACEGKVRRLAPLPQVAVEWSESGWAVRADFTPSLVELLVRLAPVTATLEVAPWHAHPLARPGPLPTADELARLRAAWADRVTVLERNPRVLAASMVKPTPYGA